MKFIGMAILLAVCAAPRAVAQEDRTHLFLSLDLLNRQTIETTNRSSIGKSKSVSTESKSAKPGGLQVTLLDGNWGLVANVAPETANAGLVGGGYRFFPGQYFGLAYILNNVEFSDETPTQRAEAYGILGYNFLAFSEKQGMSLLWTLASLSTEATQSLANGSQLTIRGSGTQATFSFRWLYKLSSNLQASPAIRFAIASNELKIAGRKVDQDVVRWEFVPLAFQLRI